VLTAIDLVLGSELGKTALTALPYPGAAPGTLIIEAIHVIDAGAGLQADRYLPPATVRSVLDQHGRRHEGKLTRERINRLQRLVDAQTALQVVRGKQAEIDRLIGAADTLANAEAPRLRAAALQAGNQVLDAEIERLTALRSINPNVRDDEIAFFTEQRDALAAAIDGARLRLDALRVIIAT
jgi:ATP-dependent helicase HepA